MSDSVFTATDSPLGGVRPFRAFSSLVRIDVAALSHVGHVRANNEDQFFVTKLVRSLETMLTSLPPGDVPHRADEVNYVMVIPLRRCWSTADSSSRARSNARACVTS